MINFDLAIKRKRFKTLQQFFGHFTATENFDSLSLFLIENLHQDLTHCFEQNKYTVVSQNAHRVNNKK